MNPGVTGVFGRRAVELVLGSPLHTCGAAASIDALPCRCVFHDVLP